MVSCWHLHVGREATVMASPSAPNSAVLPCFLVLLQRYSTLWSPPSCPFGPCPHSQQQSSPWDCSLITRLQLPATIHSGGLVFLSGLCKAVAWIVCVVLTLFRLSQISCFIQQPQLPLCEVLTPASPPPPTLWVQVWSCSLSSFSLFFLHPVDFYMVPVVMDSCQFQLVHCKVFCIWRGIPDALKRDAFYVWLLLCPLSFCLYESF